MSHKPDDLLPPDLPESVTQIIRGFAFRAAIATAMTYSFEGDTTMPAVAAAQVNFMFDNVLRHGNYTLLPTGYDDDEALFVVSSGRIKGGSHYPQQTGLLVARAGLDVVGGLWHRLPPKEVQDIVIRECGTALGCYYIHMAGIEERNVDKAAKFLRSQIGDALKSPNAINSLARTLCEIQAGNTKHLKFPNIGEHPRLKLFSAGIEATLEVSRLTLEDLSAKEYINIQPRCREINIPLHRFRRQINTANIHG